MKRMMQSSAYNNRFVNDGYKRIVSALEIEVRREVEQEFTDELNASGPFRRWFVARRVNREVAKRVSERSAHISQDALF